MRIGELAERVGVEPPTIRYYESVGVLPEPDRTPSGYRSYDVADVERLRLVVIARSLDLGLEDIREIIALRDRGVAPCGYVRGLLDRQAEVIAGRIAELERLASELAALRRRAEAIPDETINEVLCPILQHRGHAAENGERD